MCWWTSRGKLASHSQDEIASLLSQCPESWQRQVVYVLDRGFAGTPWLWELDSNQLRFILRCPHAYAWLTLRLVDSKGGCVTVRWNLLLSDSL